MVPYHLMTSKLHENDSHGEVCTWKGFDHYWWLIILLMLSEFQFYLLFKNIVCNLQSQENFSALHRYTIVFSRLWR